jgi:hypothetical protein
MSALVLEQLRCSLDISCTRFACSGQVDSGRHPNYNEKDMISARFPINSSHSVLFLTR